MPATLVPPAAVAPAVAAPAAPGPLVPPPPAEAELTTWEQIEPWYRRLLDQPIASSDELEQWLFAVGEPNAPWGGNYFYTHAQYLSAVSVNSAGDVLLVSCDACSVAVAVSGTMHAAALCMLPALAAAAPSAAAMPGAALYFLVACVCCL